MFERLIYLLQIWNYVIDVIVNRMTSYLVFLDQQVRKDGRARLRAKNKEKSLVNFIREFEENHENSTFLLLHRKEGKRNLTKFNISLFSSLSFSRRMLFKFAVSQPTFHVLIFNTVITLSPFVPP